MTFTVEMGDWVVDTLTGREGYVTGLCEYLTGCNQALVQQQKDRDGKPQEHFWVDDSRLIIVSDKPRYELPSKQGTVAPGGPRQDAPVGR